ncbi:hypothetical protein GCM10010401_14400 [Rarobacter faecitabidus]|uniref:Uncharacterized protein n=1 Tax=Rarobacter faecitabidus TaxID=13243 RepID=A0A542ZDT2_RARFA|nr:hypothetical protein [Rarobacter faecitabidus]TQL58513.1 hypothetical protein FB461_1927 [Rarobacter faecitabidus]
MESSAHLQPRSRPRRPASLNPRDADQIPGDLDPALRSEIAHTTAGVIVHGARSSEDPEVVDRLIRLVDLEGLDMVAELWADAAPDTLPGALWRLYMLREFVRRSPEDTARRYRYGIQVAPVAEAIAGAAAVPGPEDLRRLADAVLGGVYTGELDVALERAAAFCRLLAVGAAYDADGLDLVGDEHSRRLTFAAAAMDRTAAELDEAAGLWRAGRLD